jgi:hypothetical protein
MQELVTTGSILYMCSTYTCMHVSYVHVRRGGGGGVLVEE